MKFDGVYVVESSPDWFQLRWEGTHCTLCAGQGWERFSDKVTRLVQRYQNPLRLKNALKRLETGGRIESRKEYDKRSEEFKNKSEDLEIRLSHVISSAMVSVQENTPLRKNMKRFKKIGEVGEEKVKEVGEEDIFSLLDEVLEKPPTAKITGLKLKPKLKLIAAN